jgi:hypothetical protein
MKAKRTAGAVALAAAVVVAGHYGRSPGSRWVRFESGGHIFIHNDEHAKREIAAFLAAHASSRSPEIPEVREHALAR